MTKKKSVLITGGAGGLGGATALHLAKRGWRVFAADFDEKALAAVGKKRGIVAVPLDVTKQRSVAASRDIVEDSCSGLDGIVNFAGILAVGSMVEIAEADLRRVLEVNVMGTFRVNREFFPLVLEKKGRIVNVSSETGWQSGMPFNGPYAMSKHAIEAYSDSLRRELMFLDVPVIKIQPGPFKTGMVAGIENAFNRAAQASTYFAETLDRLKRLAVREQEGASDPQLIAETVETALTAARPWPAYSVKPDPQRAALNLLPAWVADPLMKVALELV